MSEAIITPSQLIEVDREDLRAVTSAVLHHWQKSSTGVGGHEYMVCRFCESWQVVNWNTHEVENPRHLSDCPVLIATSIAPRPKK